MSLILRGLYTALITPFQPDGHLDEKALIQLIERQLTSQVNGLVILGTTGETPTLSKLEKKKIIELAVKLAKGKTQILVGTGSYSTQETIEQTSLASDLGADGALVVTPYYNKPTQEGIYRHFEAISQATSLPICLYNIPGRAGQNIQIDTLKKLAQLPSIIGIKEASGGIAQPMDVIEQIKSHKNSFAVLAGDDALTLPLIALGGDGVISVTSNLIPSTMQQLVDSALEKDFEKARTLHYELLPLFKALFIETNPIPIKAALSFLSLTHPHCRLPLTELEETNKTILKKVLNTIKSIK